MFLKKPFLCTPTLLERLKCEFKSENNGRKKSWVLLNSWHFGDKRGILELRDGD
jgi:hypothetical protein